MHPVKTCLVYLYLHRYLPSSCRLITVNLNLCSRLQPLELFKSKIHKCNVEEIKGSTESDLQVNIVYFDLNMCICYSKKTMAPLQPFSLL